MASFAEVVDFNVVRSMVRQGLTHEEIACYYKQLHLNRRGLSTCSVCR